MKEIKKPGVVDMFEKHQFMKFHNELNFTKTYLPPNNTMGNSKDTSKPDVYPYRYGSYYFYEANNKTK
jgi:hypothetical protein